MLRASGITDKGAARPTNEDWFVVDDALRFLAVADGMGGHRAGEVASHVAVDAMLDLLRHPPADWTHGYDAAISPAANLLRTSVHFANEIVLRTAGTADTYAGMGTTIVAALVVGDRLAVAHVGDSRLYLLSHGRLRQLTQDDTWMSAALRTNPDLKSTEYRDHPLRHALTNVVGAHPSTVVHVDERQLTDGDLLLLTTDGVHGVLDIDRMEEMLLGGEPPGRVAADLVRAALSRGSRDNCTAVVARYSSH
jgi:PPM family protein phosphatase